MEMIKVLQIIGIVSGGGVESVIMNYYQHIDRTKIQFDFVVHEDAQENYINKIKELGGKVYKVTPYNKNPLAFTYQIYRIIKDNKYNIVHSNMNTLSIFPLFAAWLAGAKIRILHNHSTDSNKELLRTILKRILRPLSKVFANQYCACSKFAAEWMYGKRQTAKILKRGGENLKVINNAIDLHKFAFNEEKRNKLRQQLNLQNNFVIGHVGRIVKTKNYTFLLDIFKEITIQNNSAKLLLAGDGPLMQQVKDKSERLKIQDKVIFLGIRNDICDLYNAIDVLVLPSLYEGFGIVTIEAQTNGLPVICSDNITKETIISKNIKQLSLNKPPKEWAEIIVKSKREEAKLFPEAEKFNIISEATKLELFYKELI